MRQPIGAIESPDGGEWRVVFREEQKLKGWTFHAGMTSVPGPDEAVAEVEQRLREEIIADIKAQPRWVARKIELQNEVAGARR